MNDRLILLLNERDAMSIERADAVFGSTRDEELKDRILASLLVMKDMGMVEEVAGALLYAEGRDSGTVETANVLGISEEASRRVALEGLRKLWQAKTQIFGS